MNQMSDLTGLSQAEAAARLVAEGANELPQTPRRNLFKITLEIGREPMFQLLLAAGIIYLVLGSVGEALVLLASALVTIGIAIIQESRTEKVLDALKDLTSPKALVIRDGERKRIPGREVVRGDLIVIAEGDRVPADAALRSADDLQADESLLTGEAVPVRKMAQAGDFQAVRPGGDDLPLIFAGSVIVRGRGVAEVTATGAHSEMGKIGIALVAIDTGETPLHAQTRKMVTIFAVIGIGISIAAGLLYGLVRGGWLEAALAGITLAMSMLPEEFPLVLTVFLVMGAWRIAQQRVLTRRSATIEALGAATVLCTDKTGTLTLNRMSVAELRADGETCRPGKTNELPEAVHTLVEFSILASAQDPFDPMEKAFHALGQDFLATTEHIHRDWTLAHGYGLRPEMLAVSQVWRAVDRPEYVIAAKGAPEAIIDLCHLGPDATSRIETSVNEMAAEGMRVLAVANASYAGDEWPSSQHDFQFRFLGLVGLADPLRPGIREAIAECRRAGVRVVMITGDYPLTARAIAADAGLDTSGIVITGDEIAGMAKEDLCHRIADVAIFARIMPEQKLRIVEAFRANGEVVAMTGDGVNDAPALRAAHIGIAMGMRGTDVAREAASIVLLDDDFSSIVAAIRLGRRIYDNLRKAMTYILAVHVPIAGLSLLPLMLGWPLILTPVHIAFLELIIDPVCAIVFEAETEEANAMSRPPRRSDEPLFSSRLIAWSLFQGICVLAAVGVLVAVAFRLEMPEDEIRALGFTTLVLCNFSMILLDRSAGASVIAAFQRSNRSLWLVLAVTVSVLAITLYLPPVGALFRFKPLSPSEIGVALGVSAALFLLLEGVKRAASALAGRGSFHSARR